MSKLTDKYLKEATWTHGYPDTGGIAGDDDNPPGNILIGPAMKWREVDLPQGKYKVYEPIEDFEYDIFPNCAGQDKVDDYSETLQKDPIKSLFGNRTFKHMSRKPETGFKDMETFYRKFKDFDVKNKDVQEEPDEEVKKENAEMNVTDKYLIRDQYVQEFDIGMKQLLDDMFEDVKDLYDHLKKYKKSKDIRRFSSAVHRLSQSQEKKFEKWQRQADILLKTIERS